MFFFDLSLNAQFATGKGNKSSSQPVPIVRFPSWFWMVVWAKQRCGSCFSCRRGRGAANPEPVGVRARTRPRGARGFQRMGTASKLSRVQGEPRRRETRTRKNPTCRSGTPHLSYLVPAAASTASLSHLAAQPRLQIPFQSGGEARSPAARHSCGGSCWRTGSGSPSSGWSPGGEPLLGLAPAAPGAQSRPPALRALPSASAGDPRGAPRTAACGAGCWFAFQVCLFVF